MKVPWVFVSEVEGVKNNPHFEKSSDLKKVFYIGDNEFGKGLDVNEVAQFLTTTKKGRKVLDNYL